MEEKTDIGAIFLVVALVIMILCLANICNTQNEYLEVKEKELETCKFQLNPKETITHNGVTYIKK